MSVHVICIGSELLNGQTLNTNLVFIGARLGDLGIAVDCEAAIPDDAPVIRAVVGAALDAADLVITVGGLGPTADDITRDVVADVLGVPLVADTATAERIRALYRHRGIRGHEEGIHRQSLMPAGADLLLNERGTAPGIWWQDAHRCLLMLPGPPRELHPMFETTALPRLVGFLQPTIARETFSILGVPESVVERRTLVAIAAWPSVRPAYCAEFDRVRLRLEVDHAERDILPAVAAAVRAEFGEDALPGRAELAALIAEIMKARHGRLGTAESCTGGGIGRLLTAVPGISEVYVGGIVCYSNELKMQLLGVREETLAAHGAVSEATAGEMVAGLCERYRLDAGVAVTGIAGPGGGTPEKPVGAVYIATAVDGAVRVCHHRFTHDRETIRERSCLAALNQLRLHLQGRLE